MFPKKTVMPSGKRIKHSEIHPKISSIFQKTITSYQMFDETWEIVKQEYEQADTSNFFNLQEFSIGNERKSFSMVCVYSKLLSKTTAEGLTTVL